MIQVGKRSEGGQVTCYNSGPGIERGERGREEGREGRERGEEEREGGRGGGRRSEKGERREGGLKAGRYIGVHVGSSPVCVFQCIQYYSLIFHN